MPRNLNPGGWLGGRVGNQALSTLVLTSGMLSEPRVEGWRAFSPLTHPVTSRQGTPFFFSHTSQKAGLRPLVLTCQCLHMLDHPACQGGEGGHSQGELQF